MPFIKKALEERSAAREIQRVLRKSYNRKYLDYVCVMRWGYSETTVCHRTLQGDSPNKQAEKDPLPRSASSCASLMLANDISMKEIQEWLGH